MEVIAGIKSKVPLQEDPIHFSYNLNLKMAMKHLRNLLAKAPIPGLLIAFGLYTIALILNGKQKLRRRDEIIMGQAAMDAVINDDAAALSVLARRNLVHVDMEMVLAAAKHARGMEVFEVIRREGWNVRGLCIILSWMRGCRADA